MSCSYSSICITKMVEKELDRLEKENVIQKVEHNDWATPKTNGVHLCGDFKVTINPNVLPEHYPIHNADDMYASLNGGKVFSKIDLTHVYQQLEINEAPTQYLTINTHKLLYRYQRIPYGVTTALSIFQSVVDMLLNRIPDVQCYLDDIVLCSKSVNEHNELLDKVLSRLVRPSVRVNKQKCLFSQTFLEFWGHRIDEYGIYPTVEKVRAIKEAPKPTCVKELRLYLRLVNYYVKISLNLSTVLIPLHKLLLKDVPFKWSLECHGAMKLVSWSLIDRR